MPNTVLVRKLWLVHDLFQHFAGKPVPLLPLQWIFAFIIAFHSLTFILMGFFQRLLT